MDRVRQTIISTDTIVSTENTASPDEEITWEECYDKTTGKPLSHSPPLIQYSRKQLVELSKSPPGRHRPICLSKEYDTSEGIWDPERWFCSFNGSRGSSPLIFVNRDRKRSSEHDRDLLHKRRSSDSKTRIREEEEDVRGIVLCPQRRSFGTGCHVSQTSSLARQPGSPTDNERDRARGGDRRIGSGRIQIDRDSRFERGRFDRDEHDRFNRGFQRRNERNHRDGYYHRRKEEAEPEWFTSGPSSRSETIELRGFDKSDSEKSEPETEEEPAAESGSKPGSRSGSRAVADRYGSLETNESSSREASQHSDHEVQQSPAPAVASHFDFNDFFKIDNIPGLGKSDGPSPELDSSSGGSRFSRWFLPSASHGNSRNNSRRSSASEEFGFLAGHIEGGNRNPMIPSPTPVGRRSFSPMTSPEEQRQQQLLHMLQNSNRMNMQPLLNKVVNPRAVPAQTPANLARTGAAPGHSPLQQASVEADLKAILLSQQQNQSAAIPRHGKITTVSELEAQLKGMTVPPAGENKKFPVALPHQGHQQIPLHHPIQQHQPARSKPPPLELEPDMTAFNKLLSLMKQSGSLNDSPKMPEYLLTQQLQQQQQLKLQQQQQLKLQQQQQQLKLQQQEQQVQEQILNFVKQNPTIITKAASPVPLQMLQAAVMATPSPRGPSPNIGLLQQPSTPRAPSPIMFGSQPPLHLTAPSPVHAGQRPSPTRSLSVNSLSPTPRSPVPRIPSPQELIVHTQAIMQNALIKRQLEEQKERFVKKHHETSNSPNPMSSQQTFVAANHHTQASQNIPHYGNQTPADRMSTPTSKGCMPVSFTPTSVIRKMASEKAEEKEKQVVRVESMPPVVQHDSPKLESSQNMDTSDGYFSMNTPTSSNFLSQDSPITPASSSNFFHQVPSITTNGPSQPSTPTQSVTPTHSSGSAVPQSGAHAQTLQPFSVTTKDSKHPRPLIGQGTMQLVAGVQPKGPTASSQPHGRAILKGQNFAMQSAQMSQQRVITGQMPSTNPSGLTDQRPITGSNTTGGSNIDLIKLLEQQHIQQRLQQQQQQQHIQQASLNPTHIVSSHSIQQRSQASTVTSRPFPVPITGQTGATQVMRPSGVNTAASGNAAATNNALLLQMALQQNMSAANPRGVPQTNTLNQRNQLNQLNQMAALQAQVQSRQHLDPQVQNQAHNYYPGGLTQARPGTINPRAQYGLPGNNGLNIHGNPAMSHTMSQPGLPQPMLSQNKLFDVINGPLSPGGRGSCPMGGVGRGDGNLSRWFGNDVLRKQLPQMPPLPGHKVLTVDEIERH